MPKESLTEARDVSHESNTERCESAMQDIAQDSWKPQTDLPSTESRSADTMLQEYGFPSASQLLGQGEQAAVSMNSISSRDAVDALLTLDKLQDSLLRSSLKSGNISLAQKVLDAFDSIESFVARLAGSKQGLPGSDRGGSTSAPVRSDTGSGTGQNADSSGKGSGKKAEPDKDSGGSSEPKDHAATQTGRDSTPTSTTGDGAWAATDLGPASAKAADVLAGADIPAVFDEAGGLKGIVSFNKGIKIGAKKANVVINNTIGHAGVDKFGNGAPVPDVNNVVDANGNPVAMTWK